MMRTRIAAMVALTGMLGMCGPARAGSASHVTTTPSSKPEAPTQPAPASPLPKPAAKPATHVKAPAGPYRAIEVKVRTHDGQTLAGTLTLPNPSGRYPVVLLLSSADPQNRDASNIKDRYHPFRQLADTLTRSGLAVLRLDDRGVGGSTGRLDTLDTRARALDARDAVAFLKARRDIKPDRIALLGHSEGALIAGMIAAEDSTIHAVVLMASTGRPGRTTVEWIEHRNLAHIKAGGMERKQMFYQAMQDWIQRAKEDPWAAFFDTYDPVPTIQKVRAPLLILHGEQDANCPPTDAHVLGDAAKAAGNVDVTVHTLPGLDHAFLRVQDFTNGVAADDSSYLLQPELLGLIAGWLTAHEK